MSATLVQTTQDIAEFIRFIVTSNAIKMPDIFNHGDIGRKMIWEGDLWARPPRGGRGFSKAEVEALKLYVTCVTQTPPRIVLFYSWSYEGDGDEAI